MSTVEVTPHKSVSFIWQFGLQHLYLEGEYKAIGRYPAVVLRLPEGRSLPEEMIFFRNGKRRKLSKNEHVTVVSNDTIKVKLNDTEYELFRVVHVEFEKVLFEIQKPPVSHT